MAATSTGVDKNTHTKKNQANSCLNCVEMLLDLAKLGLLTTDTPTQHTGIQRCCCPSLLTDQRLWFAGCVQGSCSSSLTLELLLCWRWPLKPLSHMFSRLAKESGAWSVHTCSRSREVFCIRLDGTASRPAPKERQECLGSGVTASPPPLASTLTELVDFT